MKVRAVLYVLGLVCGLMSFNVAAQEGAGLSSGPVLGGGVDVQGIRNYLLGPGDSLDMRVFGLPEMNWTGEVDSEGLISLPFIETPIKAMCRSEKDIQKDVVTGYARFLKNPQISLRVVNRTSRQPATVYGAVRTPSRVQMLRNVRLNELIAVSGGLTERANGVVQIFHTEKVMCPVNGEDEEPIYDDNGVTIVKLFKITDLYSGKPEGNPVIRPGDVVTVMEAEPIYIVGGVQVPQPVLMKEGLTLLDALAQAGGVVEDAKISSVRVHRTSKPGADGLKDRTTITVDLNAISKKKAPDVMLQAYDIVEVPMKSQWDPKRLLRDMVGGTLSLFPRANLPVGAPRIIR